MPRCMWCHKPAMWQVTGTWTRGDTVIFLSCEDCRGRAAAAMGNRQVDSERAVEISWQRFLPGTH